MADQLDEHDDLRVRCYLLLAGLLARPPGEAVLRDLMALGGDAATPLGRAATALGAAAQAARAPGVEREFNRLFIGIDRGDLLPYASHYRGGGLYGRPLTALLDDMAALGVERAAGIAEPEDHVATLLEIMPGLIDGRFGQVTAPAGQAAFFRRHLAPWLPRFFEDLRAAPSAGFYQSVAAFGAAFLDIEAQAFALIEESVS